MGREDKKKYKTVKTYSEARKNKKEGRLSVEDLKEAADKLGYTVKRNPHKSKEK